MNASQEALEALRLLHERKDGWKAKIAQHQVELERLGMLQIIRNTEAVQEDAFTMSAATYLPTAGGLEELERRSRSNTGSGGGSSSALAFS